MSDRSRVRRIAGSRFLRRETMEAWQDRREAEEEEKRGLSPEERAAVERVEGLPLGVLLPTLRRNLLNHPSAGTFSRKEAQAIVRWVLKRAMAKGRIRSIVRMVRLGDELEARDLKLLFAYLSRVFRARNSPGQKGAR